MTRKLYPFTSKGTGETVYVFAISYSAITDAMKREKEWEKPLPPLLTHEIAGIQVSERNYADPDYPKNVEIWQQSFNEEGTMRLLKRIALVQKLSEEQKTAVKEWREALGEEGSRKSDKLFWLLEFALTDPDIGHIVNFATSLADPQENRIQQAAAGFQSEVQKP